MKPIDIYLNGLRDESWKDVRWLNSMFGVVRSESDVPWSVKVGPEGKGYLYLDPVDGYKPVTGNVVDTFPVIRSDESLDLPDDAWSGLEKSKDGIIKTTVGNAFFNRLTNYAVGDAAMVPYIHGKISAGQVESILTKMTVDDKEYKEGSKDTIRASTLPKAIDAFFACTSYAHLCVPSISRKLMVPPPGIVAYKNKLFKEYEGKLDDPATIAEITNKLNDFIDAFLEGDEGLNIAINKTKVLRVSYMKRMGMIGGISAGRDDGKMTLVKNSLNEGIDFRDFPAIQNEAREGSFKRGAETALGGEWMKFVYRIMQNTVIEPGFCGTTKTKKEILEPSFASSYLDLYMKQNGTPVLIDQSIIDAHMGKEIEVYSPMYCTIKEPSYCMICSGKAMGERPNGAAQVTSDVGSLLMGLSMSAMHGKVLKTNRMQWKNHLI